MRNGKVRLSRLCEYEFCKMLGNFYTFEKNILACVPSARVSEIASVPRPLHFSAKCASEMHKFKFYVKKCVNYDFCQTCVFVPHKEAVLPHREALVPHRGVIMDQYFVLLPPTRKQ